ncbi:MAG: hypothetical protein NVS4B8_09520 [Herpetosiphon sp.]
MGMQHGKLMRRGGLLEIRAFAVVVLAVLMIGTGVLHLVMPLPFAAIVPAYLPAHLLIVYISGVAEIMGGAGLLVPATRSAAAWGLILLYIAVFPANIDMAIHNTPLGGNHYPVLLWLRLPFQILLIAWAWWCGKA